MRKLFLAAVLASAGAVAAFAEPPKRIVVAGNGLTEIVYALGAGDSIAAVDTTSLFPKRVQDLPKVGYLRALAAEGILSLNPDLLLVTEDAGPPPVLAQMAGAGLRVVKARDGHSAEILAERVRMVGSILERSDAANALVRSLAEDFAALAKSLAASSSRPRVVFVLSAGGGAPLAAGAETSAEAIFNLAGATNAIDGYKGYKPLSAEALAGSGADTIVTVTHSLQALGGEAAMRSLPQFVGAKNMRIVAFDADYLLGFGPRTAHAARDLAAALRPAETIAELPSRPWNAAP